MRPMRIFVRGGLAQTSGLWRSAICAAAFHIPACVHAESLREIADLEVQRSAPAGPLTLATSFCGNMTAFSSSKTDIESKKKTPYGEDLRHEL